MVVVLLIVVVGSGVVWRCLVKPENESQNSTLISTYLFQQSAKRSCGKDIISFVMLPFLKVILPRIHKGRCQVNKPCHTTRAEPAADIIVTQS